MNFCLINSSILPHEPCPDQLEPSGNQDRSSAYSSHKPASRLCTALADKGDEANRVYRSRHGEGPKTGFALAINSHITQATRIRHYEREKWRGRVGESQSQVKNLEQTFTFLFHLGTNTVPNPP
jgi:hypothetical protein